MTNQDRNAALLREKGYLQVAVIVVAAMLSLFLAVTVVSQIVSIGNKIKEGKYIGQTTENRHTIDVFGEGTVFAKPDIGQIDISVVTESKSYKDAQGDNNKKINPVIDAIKALGIKDDDIRTILFDTSPVYKYYKNVNGKTDILGYTTRQTIRVKIRDLDAIGKVMDKANELGANDIGALSFTFDDPEKVEFEARAKAIANAKRKAEMLAKSLGVSLGSVVSFSEEGAPRPKAAAYKMAAPPAAGAAFSPAPNIQIGQSEVQAEVNITYEIY